MRWMSPTVHCGLLAAFFFLTVACSAGGEPPPGEEPRAQVPGVPSEVSAVAGIRSATVTWEPPDSEGDGPIETWSIEFLPGGIQATALASERSTVVRGLAPGTIYQVAVRATNRVGAGPLSSPQSARTRCDRVILTSPVDVAVACLPRLRRLHL